MEFNMIQHNDENPFRFNGFTVKKETGTELDGVMYR